MGLIVTLPKKGDIPNCNYWRGITLISITSKVFSKIIQERLAKALEQHIREEQAGFRKGKSCSDHIYTLRQTLEQSKEWSTPLYANFIDFEKALLYTDFSAQVIGITSLTDTFEIKPGVK